MKNISNYKKDFSFERDVLPCHKNEMTIDPCLDIYRENSFKDILCYERKRTERSGKPFLLFVANVEKVIKAMSSMEAFNDMVTLLIRSSRDTDLCGWYRYNSEIGIIFTEIDEHGTGEAMKAISLKMREILMKNLPLNLREKIEIHFHFYPEKYNDKATIDLVDHSLYPDIATHRSQDGESCFLKRFMDVVGGGIALILFSPLFLVISALIKITSKGPVFFRQERIGLFGKKFVFLKFRSMYIDCDDSIHRDYIKKLIAGEIHASKEEESAGEVGVFKLQNDPRITPVGRFLRKTSLDEIPQFLNVLKGEMSLVGPRPSIPYEFDRYDIWHRHRLLQVKPGITGLWQVKGRSSTSFDDMVRLDLKYIREWSLWLDILLLLQTPWAVIKGKGAY